MIDTIPILRYPKTPGDSLEASVRAAMRLDDAGYPELIERLMYATQTVSMALPADIIEYRQFAPVKIDLEQYLASLERNEAIYNLLLSVNMEDSFFTSTSVEERIATLGLALYKYVSK